jgi:hypothetical protein
MTLGERRRKALELLAPPLGRSIQMEKQLIEEISDGVATLTFNRPDRLNALSTPIMEGLLEAPPTGAGCRRRSDRAGLVGARVAQGPYDGSSEGLCVVAVMAATFTRRPLRRARDGFSNPSGPVRTVVWEGRSREAPPYPDLWARSGGPPRCSDISAVGRQADMARTS